jgi:MFS family permease
VLTGRRVLRVTITVAAVAIAVSGFATAAQYEVVTVGLGLSSTFLGVLLSAQGAGSVLGGLLVGRLIGRRGVTAVAVAGTVLCAVGLLARCLPWWPALLVGAVLGGIGLPWTLVAAVTAVQTHTPAELLGRVAATANTVMFGPIALAIPLGAAAVHLGARTTLLASAAVCLAVAAAALRASAHRDPVAAAEVVSP